MDKGGEPYICEQDVMSCIIVQDKYFMWNYSYKAGRCSFFDDYYI